MPFDVFPEKRKVIESQSKCDFLDCQIRVEQVIPDIFVGIFFNP